ncbi:MAG: COG1361 S-layer family protein [Candidatus Micrarchaeia archaeon]
MVRNRLLLAMVGLLMYSVFASFSVTDYSVSPAQIAPGEYGTLNLVIHNLETGSSVSGVVIEIRKPTQITMQESINVGYLAPTGSATMSIPFKVESGMKTGIYPIELDIYGKVPTSTGGTEIEHKKIITSLSVVNPPALQTSLDNNELSDVSQRMLVIKNNGGIAKNLYVDITSNEFGFLGKDVVYVDRVVDNVSLPIVIDAKSASEGPQKIQIKLSYEDELGNKYSSERSIPITVRKESGDFVFVQEGVVVTGKEDLLKLKVRNKGDDVQNLRFSVEGSTVQLVGVSEYEIGGLKRGQEKEISIPIIASVEPGTRSVTLNLKWVEGGENKEGSKVIPIKVSSDADVGVYLEAKPTPLYMDTEHTISVTVSNLGSYNIEATTVQFSSDAFYLLSIQPEQYIGELGKDDFSSVQYKVKTKDVEEGTYNINILVKYRDASGEWKQKNVSLPVSISKKPVSKGPGAEIYIGMVVIAGAIAYWFFVRKKKAK